MINRKKRGGTTDAGDDDAASTSSDVSNDAVVVNVVGNVGGGGGRLQQHNKKSTMSSTLPPVMAYQQRPESGYPNWDKQKQTESQFYNIKNHRSKSSRARLWNKLQHDATHKIALSLTATPTIVEEC